MSVFPKTRAAAGYIAGTGPGERFGRQDFIARVAERAGVDEPQAATSSGP